MNEPRVYENVLPPDYRTHFALYQECLAERQRVGVDVMQFKHVRIPMVLREGARPYEPETWLIDFNWLKDKVFDELLVTRQRFTADEVHTLARAYHQRGYDSDEGRELLTRVDIFVNELDADERAKQDIRSNQLRAFR